MFQIELLSWNWIDGSVDNPKDYCLHGEVRVQLGDEVITDCCTVSAAALQLLKTINEDHLLPSSNQQMLPCCGFFLVPDEELKNVEIIGCDNGVDWEIRHEGEKLIIVTPLGAIVKVSPTEYVAEVFRFADSVESIYKSCKPKIFTDTFEENGYRAFWNEWHRRRGVCVANNS